MYLTTFHPQAFQGNVFYIAHLRYVLNLFYPTENLHDS